MTNDGQAESAPTTVTVHFWASGEGDAVVAGQVVDERGRGVAFTGWIGLLEVLEACATPAAAPQGASR